jgi:hypothetical protein
MVLYRFFEKVFIMKTISAKARTKIVAVNATTQVVTPKELMKIEPIKGVVDALHSANRAMGSVLENVKKAAKLAVEQLDAGIDSVDTRVRKVTECYAESLGANKYVAAMFKQRLQLFAAGSQPLSFEVKGKEIHTTATEAAEAPKEIAEAATKELNALRGVGRAPRQTVAKPAAASVEVAKLSDDGLILVIKSRLASGDKFAAKLRDLLESVNFEI